MPASSEKQRRFMGMKLSEQRKTGHNSTGMSENQLRDFAKKRKKGRKKSRRKKRRGGR